MDGHEDEVVGNVAEVWRFPVKSMLGERRERIEVTTAGVVGDRGWALLDAEDGKVVSAKNPRKWGRVLQLRAAYLEEPVAGEPVPDVAVETPDGTVVRSGDPGADATLSAFLGREVRLSATAPDRTVMEETWPDVDGLAPEAFIRRTRIETPVADEVVSDIAIAMAAPPGTFFDLAVLHVLSTSTLAELARIQPDGEWDVRRYRPNVLVDTPGTGFVENGWVGRRLSLGLHAAMQVTMPTMRCIMTTLAQEDLPRDPSLLRTVARSNHLTIGDIGSWACAGIYGDAAAPGVVAVGDTVRAGDPAGGRAPARA